MDIREILTEQLNMLKDKGVASSIFELRMLLGHVLQKSPSMLWFNDETLTEEQINKFKDLVKMRARHCPVDKIIGTKGFYKYDFVVNQDVLSPRADSEILVEEALKLICHNNYQKILEFGVGSGCLIISILAEAKNCHGIGIDISDKALNIAKLNAKNIGVTDRLNLFRKSWFDIDNTNIEHDFDMIISNPPYIQSDEIASLQDEVKNFDPIIALDGGQDGLRDYQQICKLASKLLKPHGALLFEIGEGQAEEVKQIAKENNLIWHKTVKDLNNINRCIIFEKRDCN